MKNLLTVFVFILASYSVLAACSGGAPATGYDYSGSIIIDGLTSSEGIDVLIKDSYGNTVVQANGTTDTNGKYNLFLSYEADCTNLTNDTAVVAGETIHFYLNDVLIMTATSNTTVPVWVPISLTRNFSHSDGTPPSAPGGVSAAETGDHEINVTWTAATDDLGVRKYLVYRSTESGVQGQNIGNSTGLYYTDITYTSDGSTYYYSITAMDTSNEGTASAQDSAVSTDNVAPGMPTGFTVSNVGYMEHMLEATWDDAPESDFASWTIWYSDDNLTFSVFDSGIMNNESFMSLEDDTTFYFKLGARDTSGNFGLNTSAVEAMSLDDVAPDHTSATINATDSAGQEDEVLLDWGGFDAPQSDIIGYLLFRDDVLIGNLLGSANTSYTDSGVSDGTTYTYSVTAYDEVPNYSNNITDTATAVDDVSPAAVTGAGVLTGNMTANVSWEAVTTNSDASAIVDLEGYRVYMNTSGSWNEVYQGTSAWYYNSTLPNNIEYHFRIVAYDDAGNEGTPVIVSGTPSEGPVITTTAASHIRPVSGFDLDFSSSIGLDHVSYYVVNSTGGVIASGSGIMAGNLTETITIDPSAWSECQHTIAAYANDTIGRETYTNFSVTVDDTAPTLSLVTAPTIGNNQTLLTFNITTTDSSGIQYVQLRRPGNTITSTNGVGGLYSIITDAEQLDCNEGTCTVTVRTYDIVNNYNETEANITVDNVAPAVSSATLSANYTKSADTVVINLSATDSTGIASVYTSVTNGTPVTLANRTATDYSATTTAADLGCTEGTCSIIMVVQDLAGNSDTSNILHLVVDDSHPVVHDVWMNSTNPSNAIRPDEDIIVYANVTEAYSNITLIRVQDGPDMTLSSGTTYMAVTNATALGFAVGMADRIYVEVNDTVGNFNDTEYQNVWVKERATITISNPTDDIEIVPPSGDRFLVDLNFSVSETANCSYRHSVVFFSSPPQCTVVSCDDTGCVYACGTGGGGGGSPSIPLGENTTFSRQLNLSGDYKNTISLTCVDDFYMASTARFGPFVTKENPLTLEWSTIMRPLLVQGQWANINASVTNLHNLSSINVTVTYPDNSTSTEEVAFPRGSAIDQNVYYSLNATSQVGEYSMLLEIFDANGNEVNATEAFRVYGGANHSVSSGGGGGGSAGLNATVEYRDPETNSVINVASGGGGSVTVPNTTIRMDFRLEEESMSVIVPTFDASSGGGSRYYADRLEENVTEETQKIGPNATVHRYQPLKSYAFELENATDYNTTFMVKFDYSGLSISDPEKLVVYKSIYNFTNGTPDYRSGVYYRYGDSTYPLYLNTTAEYAYIIVDSFSSFLLGEDRAVNEICGDGIDNDYDGSVDEGCGSSSSSSSSSGGGGGGGGLSLGAIYRTAYQQIAANKHVNITMDRTGLPMKAIRFRARQQMQEVEVTIQGLSEKPDSVTELADSYKYMKVTFENLGAVEDMQYMFSVPKEWFDNNSFSRDHVRLFTWDGSDWSDVETERTGSSDDGLEYVAYTSETGYVAVALMAPPPVDVIEEEVEPVEPVEEEVEEEQEQDLTGDVTIDVPDEPQEEPKRSIAGYIIGIFCLFLAAMAVVFYEVKKHHDEHKREMAAKDQPKEAKPGKDKSDSQEQKK